MARSLDASIVIPTYQRPTEYAQVRRDLDAQTLQTFEVIPLTGRGPLARLRNEGLSHAQAPVVCFLDDDVRLPRTWLAAVCQTFADRPDVVGVTGPAVIDEQHRQHRDLFRYPTLRRLYDAAFLDRPDLPGHLARSGAYTTAASEVGCTYEGEVDYLEACNMAFRTAALRQIGGFDEVFAGVGDWSEPDASLRVRRRTGGSLWFTPRAGLVHQPAAGGATLFRRSDARQRLANADLFFRRYRFRGWRHRAYRAFLWTYYTVDRWRS